jgi:Domain of unknown function (DUF1707)
MAATNDPRSDLDSGEFHERLERCLEAKTYAELDELVADIPGAEAERDRSRRAWPSRPWPLVLLPLAVIAAIAATGGHLVWLALPLVFLFVVRPFVWRSSSRGRWACGPALTGGTRSRLTGTSPAQT